jgi:hypothetical protein
MDSTLQPLPWSRELPLNRQEEFAAELRRTPERLLPHLIAAWKTTAEFYANPGPLLRLVAAPGEGFAYLRPPTS